MSGPVPVLAIVNVAVAVEGWQSQNCSERGRSHRHPKRAMEIVPTTLEDTVILLSDLYINVALWPAGNIRVANLWDADARAGLHARRNVDGHLVT